MKVRFFFIGDDQTYPYSPYVKSDQPIKNAQSECGLLGTFIQGLFTMVGEGGKSSAQLTGKWFKL